LCSQTLCKWAWWKTKPEFDLIKHKQSRSYQQNDLDKELQQGMQRTKQRQLGIVVDWIT
jgi:hypothetical protein